MRQKPKQYGAGEERVGGGGEGEREGGRETGKGNEEKVERLASREKRREK